MPDETRTSPGGKISGLISNALRLFRTEMALAKEEVSENATKALSSACLLIAGALVGAVALVAYAVLAGMGLVALGLPVWLAGLSVAVILTVLTLILVMVGFRGLKARKLLPTKAMTNVERDMRMLQEALDD